jgi:hypothetical protein
MTPFGVPELLGLEIEIAKFLFPGSRQEAALIPLG